MNVQATSSSVAYTLKGNGGADVFTVGNAGVLTGIQGMVTLLNGASNIVVDATADTTSRDSPVRRERGLRAGWPGLGNTALIRYEEVFGSSLTVNTSNQTNTVTVNQAFGVPTTLNLGTGGDQVYVFATGANVAYTITWRRPAPTPWASGLGGNSAGFRGR